MNAPPFPVFDAQATAALLDFRALVDALAVAAREQVAGRIHAPVRASAPLGANGVLLSMLASAADIAIHKLVSVCPANRARALPTIFGTLTVCDGASGQPEFILDGPCVTGRRTAALSMLGIRLFHPGTDMPRCVLIIGTGQQARFHALALGALHPRARLFVQGRSAASEAAFCQQMACERVTVSPAGGVAPAAADTVIAATTSKTPVYTDAARAGRLVIGVGAFTPDAAEIGADTVRASRLVVDDGEAARAEAGDLLLAGVDWARVRSVGELVDDPAGVTDMVDAAHCPVGECKDGSACEWAAQAGGGSAAHASTAAPCALAASSMSSDDAPVLFKTVGSGAWDLAAGRVARAAVREAAAHETAY